MSFNIKVAWSCWTVWKGCSHADKNTVEVWSNQILMGILLCTIHLITSSIVTFFGFNRSMLSYLLEWVLLSSFWIHINIHLTMWVPHQILCKSNEYWQCSSLMSWSVRSIHGWKEERQQESVSNSFSTCTSQEIKKTFKTFLYFLHGCAWHVVVAPFATCRANPDFHPHLDSKTV
jgi:hypothetical protein